MNDKDQIQELFKSKLGSLETPVDPSMWAGIQAQLPVTATKGLSLMTKLLIGAAASGIVTTAVILSLNNSTEKQTIVQVPDVEERSEITPINTDTNEETLTFEQTENKVHKEITEHSNEADLRIEESSENKEVKESQNRRIIVDQEHLTKQDQLLEEVTEIHIQKANEEKIVQPDLNKEESSNVTVKQDETNTIEVKESSLVLPDIFTPNGDNRNDELFIDSEGLKDFSLVVLDYNNRIVYQTNDPNFRWNGTDMTGSMVPDGNYIYMLTAFDENGKPVNLSSRLRIVR